MRSRYTTHLDTPSFKPADHVRMPVLYLKEQLQSITALQIEDYSLEVSFKPLKRNNFYFCEIGILFREV